MEYTNSTNPDPDIGSVAPIIIGVTAVVPLAIVSLLSCWLLFKRKHKRRHTGQTDGGENREADLNPADLVAVTNLAIYTADFESPDGFDASPQTQSNESSERGGHVNVSPGFVSDIDESHVDTEQGCVGNKLDSQNEENHHTEYAQINDESHILPCQNIRKTDEQLQRTGKTGDVPGNAVITNILQTRTDIDDDIDIYTGQHNEGFDPDLEDANGSCNVKILNNGACKYVKQECNTAFSPGDLGGQERIGIRGMNSQSSETMGNLSYVIREPDIYSCGDPTEPASDGNVPRITVTSDTDALDNSIKTYDENLLQQVPRVYRDAADTENDMSIDLHQNLSIINTSSDIMPELDIYSGSSGECKHNPRIMKNGSHAGILGRSNSTLTHNIAQVSHRSVVDCHSATDTCTDNDVRTVGNSNEIIPELDIYSSIVQKVTPSGGNGEFTSCIGITAEIDDDIYSSLKATDANKPHNEAPGTYVCAERENQHDEIIDIDENTDIYSSPNILRQHSDQSHDDSDISNDIYS